MPAMRLVVVAGMPSLENSVAGNLLCRRAWDLAERWRDDGKMTDA
jgi:hypothetical protein